MNLLNILRVLLLAATVGSYTPQYVRLFTLGSSTGISLAGVFLNALVGQLQAASMYFLFKSVPLMEYGVPIANPPSTGDWLNLSQVLVQWGCSLLLLFLVVQVSTPNRVSAGSLDMKPGLAIWLLFTHAALFTFAAIAVGRPKDVVFTIVTNINASIFSPVMTLLTAVAVFCQTRITRSTVQPNSLSKSTLFLQSLVFLLLAVAWPFRMKLPINMWRLGKKPALLMEWYPWVGWACVNNAVLGFGQAILLFIILGMGGNESWLTGETQPLLVS